MAKRWTRRDDDFLHRYFDALGDFIGVHDLSRPKGAATKRVAKLRSSGAWAALDRVAAANRDYRLATRTAGLDDLEGADA